MAERTKRKFDIATKVEAVQQRRNGASLTQVGAQYGVVEEMCCQYRRRSRASN